MIWLSKITNAVLMVQIQHAMVYVALQLSTVQKIFLPAAPNVVQKIRVLVMANAALITMLVYKMASP
jgi:hypothetical protein